MPGVLPLLLGCSSFTQITSLELSRVSQVAVGGSTYSAALDSEGGCWQDGWLRTTLGGLEATASYSVSSSFRDCSEMGFAWSETEALDAEPQVALIFEDRVSSYPVVLGNWPTAERALHPVDPLSGRDLPGRTVRFVLEGPGEIHPETQVSLLTADRYLELPEEGGAVFIEERMIEVTFPEDFQSPIELRFEGAWPAEVMENDLGVELSFFPGDDGAIIAL